jgi:hypothetical protein
MAKLEQESCPLCGALPCDWVDDPHKLHEKNETRLQEATRIIAALKDFTPGSETQTIFGKDYAEWRHRAILWLLDQ